MKSIIKFLPLGLLALAAVACDDNDTAQPAVAAIEADNTRLDVNQTVTIRFTGQADNVVVYTGDTDHDYELREEGNYGVVVNKGFITYSYDKPGKYHLVCVATNHEDLGRSFFRDTTSVWLTVVDDITEIKKLSAPAVLYDEVFATAVNATDWMLPIPRKIHYKTSDPSVNLKKQKLKFYIDSQTSSIELKAEDADEYAAYVSSTQYNLEKPYDIRVTSDAGSVRDYKLYTLNYGEFKSFQAAGKTAKITRTEYDYTYYEINLAVPAGTDLTKLAPKFTLYGDNEKVYLPDGTEMVSGNTYDFSQPVTLKFVVTCPQNPAITLESTCVVTITAD